MPDGRAIKFMAAVTGLFLLPFLILGDHFISGTAELSRRDTLALLEMRVRAAAGFTSDLLNLHYGLVRLSGDPRVVSGGAEAARAALSERLKENPAVISELALVSRDGAALARAGAPAGRPLAGSPVFKEAVSSAGPVGAVEYSHDAPPSLITAEPAGPAGRPSRVLMGRLSLAYLNENFRALGRDSLGSMGLLDAGGQLISDSAGRSIVEPGLAAPVEAVRLAEAAAGRGLSSFRSPVSFRGKRHLAAVAAVPGTGWWVYEAVPADKVLDYAAASWARRVVATGVLLMLVFGFISYRLALFLLVPAPRPGEGENPRR